jgi:hypothetical protein
MFICWVFHVSNNNSCCIADHDANFCAAYPDTYTHYTHSDAYSHPTNRDSHFRSAHSYVHVSATERNPNAHSADDHADTDFTDGDESPSHTYAND